MEHLHLAHSLADAFNALANEVQTLTDRKTILEHKLRFAHEQFQYLADKYAPAAPEIADTLAKLQLPLYTLDSSLPVPLPRSYEPKSQHQIALVIRDGRRAASQLVSLGEASKTTASSKVSFSHTSEAASSMSTALEQDFTVEGKKGNLQCPFSKPVTATAGSDAQREPSSEVKPGLDPAPHTSMDPICAAMYDESNSQNTRTNGSSAGKCPIRYMDKHSPEEIAHYVERHKHELPRSHEVCLRRYKHDEQVKKIDSKYGDIVSMIEGLGQLHQPMLPEDDDPRRSEDVAQPSNERVEDWAQAVSVNTNPDENHDASSEPDGDRQSHFDRPLKEVRVGESPSRPWGISVPVYEPMGLGHQPLSPPPAPVRMPSPFQRAASPVKKSSGKCPFDHTKLGAPKMMPPSTHHAPFSAESATAAPPPPLSPVQDTPPPPRSPKATGESAAPPQPAFINPEIMKGAGNMPQMVFTGPVFIGYPMEQAIQFMNQHTRG